MRPHFEVDPVPTRITFHIGHGDLSLAQRPAAAHALRRVVHVGHILAYPRVQLVLKVATLFPGANVFALDHLDVMRQAADHKHVRQLRAELVIELGFFAFLAVAKELGFLRGVGRKERRVVAVLAHRQGDKALLSQFKLAPLRDQHLSGDFVLQLTHRLVGVHRQVFDRTATLRPNHVGTPAVVSKAAGDA